MNEGTVIWKVRAIKPYPEAHNHLLIGRVLSQQGPCLSLLCRTFHFGRNVNSVKDIVPGALGKRLIPWGRIEIVNELAGSFNFEQARLVKDAKGNVSLSDGADSCLIASRRDGR
ncbi:MAG: hypothetical protein NTV86_19760 [Planctomycetota bacterium]|nr:hypothetical protein [Planctomycetota bacterium]